MKIALERRQTEVELPQIPPGAALFFDEQPIAPGQRTIRTDAGTHEITVVTADGEIRSRTIEAGVRQVSAPPLAPDFAALREKGAIHIVHETPLADVPIAGSADDLDVALVFPQRVSVFEALTGTERWGHDGEGWHSPPALLGEVVVVAGDRLETTTTGGGGRGGETHSVTTMKAVVVEYDRRTGQVQWRETYDRAAIVDADGARALVAANGSLRICEGRNAPRTIALDFNRSSNDVDILTSRFGGAGVVMTNAARTILRTFTTNGQQGWRLDVADGVGSIERGGDTLLVVTRGNRLLSVSPSHGTIIWEKSYDRPIRFVRFDGATVLVLDGGNRIDRVALADGATTSHVLPLGDMPIVTGCEVTAQGRIVLLIADHRLVVVNPASMQVEWPYDWPERIVWFGSARGIMIAATTAARLAVLGVTERDRIVGWIDSVDAASRTARVRTLAASIGPARLRSFSFADYRARRNAGTAIEVREAQRARDGIVTLPVEAPGTIEAGQLLVRSGAIRVAEVDDDTAVWIDGSFECRRGCVITGLEDGTHEVLVTRRGFQPFRTSIDVGSDVVDVTPRFDRRSADTLLVIDTRPRDAEVFVGKAYVGITRDGPLEWPRLSLGQFSSVRASKFGYVTEVREFEMTESRREETFHLRQAPRFAEAFIGAAQESGQHIVGWAEPSITTDGVVGPPVREEKPKPALFFGRVLVASSWRRFETEATAEVRSVEERRVEWAAGASYHLGHVALLGGTSVGLRYFAGTSAAASSAPTISIGETSTSDSNAPLEEWSHPIRNVFVNNDPPHGVEAMLTLRPQVHTFIRIAGGVIGGETFSGTALVRDPTSGHLVKDPSRSYTVTTESGWRASVEAQTPLALMLRPFGVALRPRLVLYMRYEATHMSYGILDDEWQRFLFGIGLVTYQSW